MISLTRRCDGAFDEGWRLATVRRTAHHVHHDLDGSNVALKYSLFAMPKLLLNGASPFKVAAYDNFKAFNCPAFDVLAAVLEN